MALAVNQQDLFPVSLLYGVRSYLNKAWRSLLSQQTSVVRGRTGKRKAGTVARSHSSQEMEFLGCCVNLLNCMR